MPALSVLLDPQPQKQNVESANISTTQVRTPHNSTQSHLTYPAMARETLTSFSGLKIVNEDFKQSFLDVRGFHIAHAKKLRNTTEVHQLRGIFTCPTNIKQQEQIRVHIQDAHCRSARQHDESRQASRRRAVLKVTKACGPRPESLRFCLRKTPKTRIRTARLVSERVVFARHIGAQCSGCQGLPSATDCDAGEKLLADKLDILMSREREGETEVAMAMCCRWWVRVMNVSRLDSTR